VASYVTAAQIQALRDTCRDHGVESAGFWLKRLCLNTVLNENIAGRRAAFRTVLPRSRKFGRRIIRLPVKNVPVSRRMKCGPFFEYLHKRAGNMPVIERFMFLLLSL
jgi:hypothetical protein